KTGRCATLRIRSFRQEGSNSVEAEIAASRRRDLPRAPAPARKKKSGARAPLFPSSPKEIFFLAVEQRQDGLRRLVGDRESLNAELLLDLQGLQHGAFLRHVGVDQLAQTGGQRVGQLGGERRLDRELL